MSNSEEKISDKEQSENGKRFKQALIHLDTNINALSEKLDITYHTLRNYGNKMMPADVFIKLIELYPQVNWFWVVTGKGAMLGDAFAPFRKQVNEQKNNLILLRDLLKNPEQNKASLEIVMNKIIDVLENAVK